MPGSVKKYYMRKKLLLAPVKEALELNRKCEQMFKDGDDHLKIAEYYTVERSKIDKRAEEINKRLKAFDKNKVKTSKTNKKKK